MVMALNYEKPPYAVLRNNLEVLLQHMRHHHMTPLDLQMVESRASDLQLEVEYEVVQLRGLLFELRAPKRIS